MTGPDAQARLIAVLAGHPALAIAVSGGVDSMVLAYIAHNISPASVVAVHAVSPAVPEEATRRVRDLADRFGWMLQLLDAEELSNPDYVANPVNRCFFCKTNLYKRIRHITALPIASGTNTDDLSDFRPGLAAASLHGVVHPYVEAGVSKDEIYALARRHRLDDLSELPAQPCLASRIETGIGVDARTLTFIDTVERALSTLLPRQAALRCRITARGVVVECDPLPTGNTRAEAERLAAALCVTAGRSFVDLRTYSRGSAFLVPQGAA